jgi:hypothetical protein
MNQRAKRTTQPGRSTPPEGGMTSTDGSTIEPRCTHPRVRRVYVDVDVRCAGETSGIAAHAFGDQEERRRERRSWSQVVAVTSGLPADVVAV